MSCADHNPRLSGATLHQNCKCLFLLLIDYIFVQLCEGDNNPVNHCIGTTGYLWPKM